MTRPALDASTEPRSATDRNPMREGPERVPVVIEETYDGIARLIAGRIAGLIRERGASVRRTVLGLATGSPPIGIYRGLIRLHGQAGHIGFNEPGSGPTSRTRLVVLDSITRRVAASDFFGAENVPTEAITMGVGTIVASREIALLATGEHKAAIVKRAVEGEIDRSVAATFLQQHPNAAFYLDAPAAAELTRRKTPWLLGEIAWDPRLELEAVTWLSGVTKKSVLKLADVDYREHHLGSLLLRHGSAGELNGNVFNALSAKVRG